MDHYDRINDIEKSENRKEFVTFFIANISVQTDKKKVFQTNIDFVLCLV